MLIPCVSLTELKQHCLDVGFSLSDYEIETLAGYLQLLTQWNTVTNLVSPKTWQAIFTTLIVDSFYLATFIPSLKLSSTFICYDFGAGAGLPGIPLRIMWQEGHYWLIESREKRALFLKNFLARYPLPQTYVYHGRVEQFVTQEKIQQPVDLLISRAFMPWPSLYTFVEEFMNFQGIMILLLRKEIPTALTRCVDWEIQATYSYLIGNDKRFFVALKHSKK